MKKLILILSLAVLVASPAAANYSLQFTGLDIFYDGNNIYTGLPYAPGIDVLTTMVEDNNGTVTAFSNPPTDMTANMLIAGVGPLLAGGQQKVILPSSPLLFDLTLGSGFLNLNWDQEVTVTYTQDSGMSILMAGTTDTIVGTNLPIGTPVTVSFSTQINDFEIGFLNQTQTQGVGGLGDDDDAEYLLWADASGTGEVRGPNAEIPEPATLLLLGGGLLGGAIARRRRKN